MPPTVPRKLRPGQRCPDYLASATPVKALVKGFYFMKDPNRESVFYLVIDGKVSNVYNSSEAMEAAHQRLLNVASVTLNKLEDIANEP